MVDEVKRRRKRIALSRRRRRKDAKAGLSFICGAAASLMTKAILQPFDTLKTLAQVGGKTSQHVIKTKGGLSLGQLQFVREGARLVRQSGVSALFRGLPATLVVSAPSSAVFFSIYDPMKTYLDKEKSFGFDCGPNLSALIASTCGNLVSSVIRVPPENVKQQVQAGLYQNGLQATRSIVSQGGIQALYRGYLAQLLKDIPYSAVQFTVYDWIKRRRERIEIQTGHHHRLNGPYVHISGKDLIGGALAGASAVLLTSPLDVVKTRIMTTKTTSSIGLVSPPTRKHQLGVLRMCLLIYQKEGPKALFRGLLPRLMQKVPSSALYLITYEYLTQTLLR